MKLIEVEGKNDRIFFSTVFSMVLKNFKNHVSHERFEIKNIQEDNMKSLQRMLRGNLNKKMYYLWGYRQTKHVR